MSSIFRQLSNRLYTIPRCQVLIAPLDPLTLLPVGALRNLGDATADVDSKVEYEDIKSMEDNLHRTVASPAVGAECDIKIKVRQFNAFVSGLAFQSPLNQSVVLPAAAPGLTDTINGVTWGGIYTITDANGQFVSGVVVHSVTDDSALPVPYVLGVNYVVDVLTGRVEVISPPAGVKYAADGVTTNVVITYDVPPPAPGALPNVYSFLSQPENYCYVALRTNNRIGMNRWFEFTLTRQGVNGGFKVGAEGNEAMSVELSFKVLFDARQLPGREFGFIRDLSPMSAIGG